MDIDRYQLATSGQQHLDSDFLYHISVLRSPLLVKFGVNAWGPDFSHTHYDITRPRYRSSQVPPYSRQLDTLQFSLVAAIHNIFELGVEQAMLENRDAASHVSAQNEASLPVPGEEVPGVSTGQLAALLEEVEQSTGARREALRQEVLRLEKEAAQRRMAPLSF